MHNQTRRGRRLRGLMVLAGSMILTGCQWAQLVKPHNPFASPPPCVFAPDVSKEEIIAHLNANASRLTSWRSTKVGIHLKQKGSIPVDLTAQMAVESPRNFRLRASSLLGEEADFGSNQERFWFWIRRSPQPYVITAAHEDMETAQRQLPIPFNPEWVMEAFGVVMIDPSQYTLERLSDNRVSLMSNEVSPSGQTMIKSIGVDLCTGKIVEHALYDARGTLVARAQIGNHTTTSDGISIPHRVVLEWPQAGTTMKMGMLDVEVNPSYTPESMWQVPEIAPVIHLGQ
ncbi:MAG: hypothetical protein HUJ26_21530 [Planctomycetaceae bacterium]|nr:hypothetical protein [Planctomycetaceae bacterium]